jgi:hypothetical protein
MISDGVDIIIELSLAAHGRWPGSVCVWGIEVGVAMVG